MRSPPETCPQCGADLPPNARSCPECGSDEHTGWSEEAAYSGLNLPEENFDYAEFVKREFESKSPAPRGVKWIWWVVALLLAAAFILGLVL